MDYAEDYPDTYIPHMPGYIPEIKTSSIILYKDSEEGYPEYTYLDTY
jgi:hypothetical protein